MIKNSGDLAVFMKRTLLAIQQPDTYLDIAENAIRYKHILLGLPPLSANTIIKPYSMDGRNQGELNSFGHAILPRHTCLPCVYCLLLYAIQIFFLWPMISVTYNFTLHKP